MASKSNDETIDIAALGQEGDACAACGTPLAIDQRYCLNCGEARAEPRLDFTKHIGANGAAANGVAPAAGAAPSAQWNPVAAVGAIAILGVMLLLGVLIGNKDNETTVAAAPTTTTTAAPVAAAPTDTAAADAGKGKGGKDDAAKAAKASAGGVQGGSGSTEGISTDNPLEGLTGDALVEAQKNAPDVVATDGEQAALDPGPAGGGEGGGTCIGC